MDRVDTEYLSKILLKSLDYLTLIIQHQYNSQWIYVMTQHLKVILGCTIYSN